MSYVYVVLLLLIVLGLSHVETNASPIVYMVVKRVATMFIPLSGSPKYSSTWFFQVISEFEVTCHLACQRSLGGTPKFAEAGRLEEKRSEKAGQ